MMKDDKLDFDVEVFPSMRVYLNCYTNDGDQFEVEEFMDLIEEKGIAQYIRELIDNGILNVYYCNYDKVSKII